ncbi:hypothetical protein PS3A_34660 [Pseudomonas sp. 3A(2025)]
MFNPANITCNTISAQALACTPQITHSTLLRQKHQKPIMRLRGKCEPVNHAARTVMAIAGH